jgi:hypothetical protein
MLTSVTQIAPAEVIFKYASSTKLSMLLPEDKDTRWVPVEPLRKNFEIGECIFVRNHKKAGVKWLPGIIDKKLESVRYMVQLSTSEQVVHTNQSRKGFLSHPINVGRKEWVLMPVHPSLSNPDHVHSPQSCLSLRLSPTSPGGSDLQSPQMGSSQEEATPVAVR